jgi:hypothetical protein|tara:strand:- start:272 stop:559 length:288 start_codon:yes stop_codon:yes gene_type:complete
MGRLNKKYFDSIAVASYRLHEGEEQDGTNARIISQRSTKKFKLQIGEVSAVCTLVAKPAGTLLADEFRIEINGGNVSKITNRSYTVNGKKTQITE